MADEIMRITGGTTVRGETTVQGAKNSVLPIMAAAMLCQGETVLTNVPQLSDVYAASRILNRLGAHCKPDGHTVTVNAADICRAEIPDADMRAMRSTIMFMGPMLGRMRQCTLTHPGGCALGARPINLHLDAMEKMGVLIRCTGEQIVCTAEKLHGARIPLSFPSVGVTENVIMAAVLAEGETVLTNAAREPEIADLAGFLNCCGAKIRGAGEGTIVIEGVPELHAAEYRIMPDRIAAMTWLCAAAATRGSLTLHDVRPGDLENCLDLLRRAGCSIGECGNTLFLDAGGVLRSIRDIVTMPYPGFPTDAQALLMAVLATAHGTSVFDETIFEDRYKHVSELVRMGADIRIKGTAAVVEGVKRLHGAYVEAMDLRGGAALAVAAAGAEGETILHGLTHIDRGYDRFAEVFNSMGIHTERMPISSAARGKTIA